ncbi:MAG: hypothetical protein EON54_23925 [Alcaligenaceae bacterium]|jgi:hypothetical protein|nr:MAG: hypothetical protein EON54_23925 [Alcaligenaceae bacterium]
MHPNKNTRLQKRIKKRDNPTSIVLRQPQESLICNTLLVLENKMRDKITLQQKSKDIFDRHFQQRQKHTAKEIIF